MISIKIIFELDEETEQKIKNMLENDDDMLEHLEQDGLMEVDVITTIQCALDSYLDNF